MDEKVIKDLIYQARKCYNGGRCWGHKQETPALTLVHCSDIHGDLVELQRLCDFLEKFDTVIDDCVCTGDLSQLRWNTGYEFWAQDSRAKTILTCIGNHDILLDDIGWDWSQQATQKQCYERYFAPYIGAWNCAYQENKTYYYKDYEKQKIRLIVLDVMLKDTDKKEQLEWFENVLTKAQEEEQNVLVAIHYPVGNMQPIACNFTSLDRKKGVDGGEIMNEYQEKVGQFIKKDGKFICWISGHAHEDYVGYNPQYPEQLCIVINALCREQSDQYSDTDRVDGMPSQDLWNVMTIDTSSQHVKLIRIGANVDRYLRKRDTLCIQYKTFEIIK